MNILIIGSGGREHALAIKIKESKLAEKIYISPGNPGTAEVGENVNLDLKSDVVEFCKEMNVGLTVIGPEQPLVDGLANQLRKEGVSVFGPDKEAAIIEGNKSFAKNLMKKYDIPTASFETFTAEDYEKAVTYLKSSSYPIVIKASGLAAGKGVLICETLNDALEGLNDLMKDSIFGSAGDTVVIEEFMTGQEASLFAISDGDTFISLPISQDHKRIGDGDTGPNTGGMGAYAPTPIVDDQLKVEIENKIIQPTLDAMKEENRPFIGCLYAGLMLTKEGPKVVEFNCRFGDPETQVVLPLLDGDLVELLKSAADGNLKKDAVNYNGGKAVCVVAASEGYPGSYKKGVEITGLDELKDVENVIVYHAGTKKENGKIVTSGGRVLGVTYIGKRQDLSEVKTKTYEALNKVKFSGITYRNDISDKVL